MVDEVERRKGRRNDGSQREVAKIGAALAKRRRISAATGGLGVRTKAMLASVIGVALVAAFSGGGHRDTHPHLREFLASANKAASQVIRGDVEASCADPKRWLNSAGHDLLSDLPGFGDHNASMLWGTYRPGVYFGFKTRTAPVAVTAGLMWHGGDGHAGVEALRHECSEGDGLGPYGWVEHDGVSYGKQEVEDKRAGVRLVTSIVKPAQLERHNGDGGIRSDVHLASRVEVLPVGTASSPSVANPRVSTVYFYVGLDCGDADARCSAIDGENDGLAVIDPGLEPRRSLLIRGTHPQLGGFELEARAVSAGSTPGARAEGDVKVSFVGKAGVPVVDVRRYVEGLHTAHRRVRRKGGQAEEASVARKPFVLPDEVDAGSDVVLVQVTGQAPFTVDLVVRAAGLEQDKLPPGNGRHDATRPAISAESITDWLAAGSRSFSRRFRETFGLEEKGFEQRDLAAAKAALSNMLGGMGYFAGKSEVRGAGVDGGNAPSFEASLFTAVPSRSFFPRGFLWDEGFHQLLVSAWDRSTAIDVLGHWLSVMHVHDEGGEGVGKGCCGGWLPREQILGEEARRRVPAEFMAQDVTVANPPTFLLLVDSLLRGLDAAEAVGEHNARAEVCIEERRDGNAASPQTCPRLSTEGSPELESAVEFLRRAHPLLDQWMQWLLVTQRPAAKGWGGQGKTAPLGAFQWRGRDPSDDRLNALTLASGLDDYPRASHPSQDEEWHVDVLSWLALGCRVMDRLSAVVGVKSLPYGDLFNELMGGMFDLHWDAETEAFFDRGNHVSDGELIDEVLMRCLRADGSTVDVGVRLEDVHARKAVCPQGLQHMYPLGDGRGGLLARRRWQGGSPRAQHVHHVGYVSIFPLLLTLLPAESPALGGLLALMRDPTQLWSPHGLRSLSASDPFYQVENKPGDEPYWRGHIWVNVNYLALAALRHYSEEEGPFRKDARAIYSELRTNVLRTLLGGFHSTGFFWEQYDDRGGGGLRSHPFTGWTALVVLIMAEIY